jgi:hypothetical protein
MVINVIVIIMHYQVWLGLLSGLKNARSDDVGRQLDKAETTLKESEAWEAGVGPCTYSAWAGVVKRANISDGSLHVQEYRLKTYSDPAGAVAA